MTINKPYPKPKICLFDISKEVSDKLKGLNFNCFDGSLGNKVDLGNIGEYKSKFCILNNNYPSNLHEYDIFIFDLNSFSTIPHIENEYKDIITEEKAVDVFRAKNPTTIFDPRPFTAIKMGKIIRDINSHNIIVIIFSTVSYKIKYDFGYIKDHNFHSALEPEIGIYQLLSWIRAKESIEGEKMNIVKNNSLTNLFVKHLNESNYNQSFFEPSDSISLIENIKGDIVSFVKHSDNKTFLILPQFKNKADILASLLTDIFPNAIPEIFPESTTFAWTKNKEYFIPNHENLLRQKEAIEYELNNKLSDCEIKIEDNLKSYDFLYNLIKEYDDKLVKSVITFLKWLGFINVKDMDSEIQENGLKEEDIQIELEKGLLVIEVKGISGHPSDADCSQISKVKLRRCKERNKFDVFALFVVNHQRFLPPLKRSNLANEETKIKDAVYDERGIVSTWQLFNLYFEIENGVISKDEAKERLLEFGLINFRPKTISLLCKVEEIFMEGYVFIAVLNNQKIKVGDVLYIEKYDRFTKCIIQSIQLDGKDVTDVDNGEVGIKIDIPIKKNSLVYFINKGK